MKRVLCLVLAIALTVPFCLGIVTVQSSATQSRSGNFTTVGFTSTGNPAIDICNIACLQEGKTGNDFGYTEDWAADFVSDCAKLVNQSAAIPANGSVYEMWNAVLRAGGREVSDPQVGDLAVIDWDSTGSTRKDIELVYKTEGDKVYTVGGNTGSKGSLSLNFVNVRKNGISKTSAFYVKFVRPNYRGSGELPMPKLSYPTLRYGDSGVEVSMVQTMLKTLYYPNLGFGIFGNYTRECVTNFQKKAFPNNSSEWDGIVGPKTWEALITRYKSAVMLQFGNEGYNVEMLQRMLKVLHYPSLGIGNFGDYTKECVINFQKTAFPNNSSEWDGVVGSKTWEKLFAAYFSRPYSSNYPLLKYGDYGMGVMMVQTMLKTLYYPNLGFGIFGNYTRECVTNFQKKMFPNNSSEWDGIVGQKTWSNLINKYKNTVVLQYGSKGNDVLMLQKMLQVIGYSKLGTGGFGNYTKECVIDFQKKAFPNDSSKWDGVVGPETWAKLFAAYFPNYYKTVS